MRAANYSSMNIFNLEQIKEINEVIKSNFIKGNDDYAKESLKTSDVKFVNYAKIQKYIFPFVEFCLTANKPLPASLIELFVDIYLNGCES